MVRISCSLAIALLGCVAATSSLAQPQFDGFERVLVPVTAEATPGAFGSLWEARIWIRNTGSSPVKVFGFSRTICPAQCPPEEVAPIAPGTTIHPRMGAPPNFTGAFLFVDRARAGQVAYGLRFRDLSRQAESWGTEIPVVPEQEFREDGVALIDIPITQGFRHVLRVYELNGEEMREARVRVRVYRLNPNNVTPGAQLPPDPVLGEAEYQLQFVPPPSAGRFFPAYLAVSDLATVASVVDGDRVALMIEPMTPGLRLWAFVTVVNNTTQQATVITPQ